MNVACLKQIVADSKSETITDIKIERNLSEKMHLIQKSKNE